MFSNVHQCLAVKRTELYGNLTNSQENRIVDIHALEKVWSRPPVKANTAQCQTIFHSTNGNDFGF